MKLVFVSLACFFAVAFSKEQPLNLPINVELKDGEFSAYINANVGTPAQSVNLNLDFFGTSSYLVDKDANVSCDSKPQLYDYSKSSTYKLLKNYTEKYDSNFLVEDVFQFGSSKGAKRQFNLTDSYRSEWSCNSYNGALGLGVAAKSDDFIVNLLKDYPNPQLTIAPGNSKTTPPQLSLTIGGQNDAQCKSDWTEAKCSGSYEFTYPSCTFDVTGYSFGSYTLKRSSAIASASLSLQQYTYVPSDVYDHVIRGVKYSAEDGGIPCDSHPDLSIFLGKKQFTLSGKHYIGKEVGNGYCEFLIVNGVTQGLNEDLFVLPIGFFANNCQRLDYSKLSMALATGN